MKRGSTKEGKFVPSYYMEAEPEVKSNLFLGPVHWKTVTVLEQDRGQVGKSTEDDECWPY